MLAALALVVIIPAIAAVVLCGVYKLGRGGAVTLAVFYALFAMCGFAFSIVAAIHAVLLLILIIPCALGNLSPKRFAQAMAVLTALLVGTRTVQLVQRSRELDDLVARNPIQSLTARLAYERDIPDEDKLDPSVRAEDQRLPDGVDEFRIAEVEILHDNPIRSRAEGLPNARSRHRSLESLERVHESRVDEFLREEGFGVIRTLRLSARKEYIDIPDTEPIPLQCERPRESSPSQTSGDGLTSPSGVDTANSSDAGEATVGLPALDGLVAEHRNGTVDFTNPEGFGVIGYVRSGGDHKLSLDRVVGFQPHAFRRMPEFPSTGSTRWRIQELQLVSLLKHRPAAAYVSENLPRMDELVQAKTRALDDFESASLERLRAGEELVAERHGSQIRMLGSIRAVRQCLDCHHVRRGTLLGAFTYRLQPAP